MEEKCALDVSCEVHGDDIDNCPDTQQLFAAVYGPKRKREMEAITHDPVRAPKV